MARITKNYYGSGDSGQGWERWIWGSFLASTSPSQVDKNFFLAPVDQSNLLRTSEITRDLRYDRKAVTVL